MDKYIDKFTKYLVELDTISFVGLAMVLGVDFREDDAKRDPSQIVADLLNVFNGLSNSKKKEILKLCKEAIKQNKKRGGRNGQNDGSSDSDGQDNKENPDLHEV
jgi:hypothetical protein